jgi:hypothetical protein
MGSRLGWDMGAQSWRLGVASSTLAAPTNNTARFHSASLWKQYGSKSDGALALRRDFRALRKRQTAKVLRGPGLGREPFNAS